jgi:UDP-N-acetylglucosamine 2-epimerase (non-hydrolysing)
MKLCILYGTRPEFLKLKCLIDILRKTEICLQVIKIVQHNSINEDNGYYDKILNIDNMTDDRICNIGSNILQKLPPLINDFTHILAQGDTASVFYGLLCGFQMKKICIHLEAGLRTYDLENPFPEEGFRQMISRITDIHLCPSLTEKIFLESEKVKGKIFVVGNTILDLVKSYNFPILNENKVLITLHRRENWLEFKDYIIELAKLCKNNNNYLFYFLTHPNPTFKQILIELKEIIPKNMIILDSLPHIELIRLLSSCAFVITDSGGIQEEANYLGKHIYLLRKITERQSININKITICNLSNIKDIKCMKFNNELGYEYGEGNSSEIIKQLIHIN